MIPPPPPPPADTDAGLSSRREVASAEDDMQACKYSTLIEANPALAIFPIDLTKMTYDGYERAYEESEKEIKSGLIGHNSFGKFVLTPTDQAELDWSSSACQALGLATDNFKALADQLCSAAEKK